MKQEPALTPVLTGLTAHHTGNFPAVVTIPSTFIFLTESVSSSKYNSFFNNTVQ